MLLFFTLKVVYFYWTWDYLLPFCTLSECLENLLSTSNQRVILPCWKCYKTIDSWVSCAFIEIWSTWEVWRALKKLELLSATPRATLMHLSCPCFISRWTHADAWTNCQLSEKSEYLFQYLRFKFKIIRMTCWLKTWQKVLSWQEVNSHIWASYHKA